MGFFTPNKTIQIACKGADAVDINDLHELQGNLKTNTEDGYKWQKNSILELGFKFPMTVWKDDAGKMWEIDGHRRLRTLKRMRDEEGFIIPLIPITYSFNKDKVEAKETILAGISQAEQVTEQGFEEFIHEEGFEIEETHADELYTDASYLDEEEEKPKEKKPQEDKPKKEKEPECEKCKNYHERDHDQTPSPETV